MTEQSLANKLALITGAASVTGRAIATELARQGAAVALHDLPDNSRAASLTSTVQAIVAAGGRATTITGDLVQVNGCFHIVDEAATFLGGLDILVNHAEIAEAAPLLEVSPARFEQLINTNMRGSFFCTQQAVRWMEARGGGSIINSGSVAAFAGIPGHSLYAAAAGAIAGFTRQLAVELIPHEIRVNAIAPGYIAETGSTAPAPAQNSWERVGKPQDIAAMVAFLLSPAASFMTGQVLYIDGGLSSRLAIYPPLINTQELAQ
ncbi:MAG: SDR family oxidoreductase [Caldilineaceae bacterium]|nr:SDR family oxidoreductase [Caldilineaceae bacterium]